jgi:Flp pilus assembly protein TadD
MPIPFRSSDLCAALLVLASGLAALGVARADTADEVRLLLARGEHAAALQLAQKNADANPRDAQARFLQGVVLMDMQRDDDALALFSSLAQLYPELPDPMNNIALLHARAGRLDQALTALQAALRNDPGHRTARANLGQVHLMLAVQAWERVAASGPMETSLQRQLEAARALVGMPAAGGAIAAPR